MTDAGGLPWRVVAGGVVLRVRLTPKASRDGVEGIGPTAEGPAVKARVRAVPEDGAANAAVAALIAGWLGVPKTSVALTHGGKSRIKVLMVSGDADTLVSRLETLTAAF
jgi:uncharacterized protein YggU (UPF0235/DUF167 family)